ncbi:MAG: hypothetical protein LBV23_04605 [Deltaproteobacteria bacterium]|nr:hypothetical protein [Deltaproteobacteria bacterium]
MTSKKSGNTVLIKAVFKTVMRKYSIIRSYLHIYFNQTRRAENDASFDADLIELRDNIEAGVTVDDLPKREQNKVAKYLNVKTHGDNVRVSFNEAACKETKKYHGYFALV